MVTRESLLRIRTSRDVPSSMHLARFGPKAVSTLSRLRPWQAVQAAAELSAGEERKVRRQLLLEQRRFEKQQERVEASRQRIPAVRAKLARAIKRNERFLSDLRSGVQAHMSEVRSHLSDLRSGVQAHMSELRNECAEAHRAWMTRPRSRAAGPSPSSEPSGEGQEPQRKRRKRSDE